jgi:hypothetical protein
MNHIYILRLYTVYSDDNRDISYEKYNITDIGYFSDLTVLKFNAINKYKDMDIVINEFDNDLNYFADHLRVFKVKLDVMIKDEMKE